MGISHLYQTVKHIVNIVKQTNHWFNNVVHVYLSVQADVDLSKGNYN